MGRILTIAGIAATLFGAALVVFTFQLGDSGGAGSSAPDRRARDTAPPARAGQPTLVWMGDSTIMGKSYPAAIGKDLRKNPRARSRIVASWGRNAYLHYCSMGEVLRSQPALVIFVANLHRFESPRAGEQGLDHCDRIPARELPRAMLLPFARQNVTVPRLLLLQALRWQGVRSFFSRLDNTRWALRNVRWDEFMGELSMADTVRAEIVRHATETVRARKQPGSPHVAAALKSWNAAIGPSHPTVRMLRAAVDMTTRWGSEAIVLVAPVPYASLSVQGLYDHAEFERNIAGLRRAVESAGARVMDVHRILPASMMFDDFAHLEESAARPMADFLSPVLRRVLREGLDSLPPEPLDPASLARYAPEALLPR